MATVWVLTDERYLAQRMPSALVEALQRLPARTRLLVADRLVAGVAGEGGVDPWAELRAGDLVIARTRNRFALTLLPLAERPGVTVLTPWQGIAAVRDKPRAASILAAHGLPTPGTWLADSPSQLASLPRSSFPLLLKPHAGDNGRGLVLVREPSELDAITWPDSMVLAQQYVECGAVDDKLYVAGERIWLVRRPSPLVATAGERAAVCGPVEPSAEQRRLARACGRAFGLTLFGVDLVASERGPLVVDVNEFPNYTGVDEAPQTIAELVARELPVRRAA